MVAASVTPKAAFKYIRRVEAKDVDGNELAKESHIVPYEMATLDPKVSAACDAIISGSVAADIVIMSQRHVEQFDEDLPRRRKLRTIYVSYATSGKRWGLVQPR